MTSILLVDDAAALGDLFSAALRSHLECDVVFVPAVAEVEIALRDSSFDLAIVDLSYPQEDATGIDVLAEVHAASPSTTLGIITQGDRWVNDILQDAVDLLPVATVLSKSSPLDYQLDMIKRLLAGEVVPVDPAIETILRTNAGPQRSPDCFASLFPHQGHAKFWQSVLAAGHDLTYQDVVDLSGLKLNTVKNYRAQLVPELRVHGLHDPSLREMQQFAWRCRVFMRPFLTDPTRA